MSPPNSKTGENDAQYKACQVAVVGTGLSGLCAIHHFSQDSRYKVTAFEQQDRIGGLWNYPEGCEEQINDSSISPYFSRMYRDLRMNTTRALSSLQGLPFPYGEGSYASHHEMLKYLHSYADHFGLLPHIKFRHRVLTVTPTVPGHPQTTWQITTEDLATKGVTTELFDAVVICSGKVEKPYIPVLLGIENFKGPVIHSSQYRVPETYKDQTVFIIGGCTSANEVICQLLDVSKKVLVCRKTTGPNLFPQYSNIQQVSEPKDFGTDHVILDGNVKEHLDAAIICTGYRFYFPFLSAECRVNVSRGRIAPLYRHIINCEMPTMAFVGHLAFTVVSAGYDCQVLYYKAFLDGKVKLPEKARMLEVTKADFQERLKSGLSEHHAHRMGPDRLWVYIDGLAEEAGFEANEPVVRKLYNFGLSVVGKIPCQFRDFRLERVADSPELIWEITNTLQDDSDLKSIQKLAELQSIQTMILSTVIDKPTVNSSFCNTYL